MNDPVVAQKYNYGHWIPIRIKRVIEGMICSYIENGKRIFQDDIEDLEFQRILLTISSSRDG